MSSRSSMLFRYRIYILAIIVVLGFWSPWDRWFGWPSMRVWLVVPQQLSRLGLMPLERATLTVTAVAVLCALVGALSRTWATAYLDATVVYDNRMHADQVVADGPFRYVRNPLYLGTLFHVLALSILMSPSGAIFVIVAVQLFHVVLVAGEEQLMLAQRGEHYAKYLKVVPRWIPSLRAKLPSSGARPRWGQAILGEIYMCAVAVIYSALAWRYNAQLLERGILIAYGTRMVLRALVPAQKETVTK
jgi:protein-S-isoprenylcysteine O-methyltransferase Ste14